MKPDKDFVKRRFARTLEGYDRLAHVQKGIAAELASLYKCHAVGREVKTIYEIGTGTGFLTRYMKVIHPGARFVLNDLTDASRPWVGQLMDGYEYEFRAGDAERTAIPAGLDAVVSSSTVQWFEDLAGFFSRVGEATNPGGFLALSTYGPDNFREIRKVTGEGLEYHTKKQIGEMVAAAGYEVLHLSEQLQTLFFDIPLDVLHHIRATGVNAIARSRWTKASVIDFCERYGNRFRTREGVVPLTYHPAFVVARRVQVHTYT